MCEIVNKTLFFYICLLSFTTVAQIPNGHFKNISLNLWIDTKLDPETEKYWVESFSIEHVDGNRFAL